MIGLFSGGINRASGSTRSIYTDKYDLLTDAVSEGTCLVTAIYQWAACSSFTEGVFGGGSYKLGATTTSSAMTKRYVYATDTIVAGEEPPVGPLPS